MKQAVILLSGGLDSSTVLALAKSRGFNISALSIFYGQKNSIELAAAKRVVDYFKVSHHKIIELNLALIGGSSLTDKMEVKAHQEQDKHLIPNTYVPARNTIMLSMALAYAEVQGACDIFFGANIHDYSGYPDCRPDYIKAFQAMANLATKSSVEGQSITIHAPLVNKSKAEIIKLGLSLGVDYSMTHSCYDPQEQLACGRCSACFYRQKGFADAEVTDPTLYVGSVQQNFA